ncbi:MAG: FHA domain-containing protein [Anaerolineales bacterium]|nr:FHA domain-containing protein [Anaerolineales bacterium]
MTFNLAQLENRLQALIEVHLLNPLPAINKGQSVAAQIAEAMYTNIAEVDDKKVAPYLYTLSARPELIETWQADSALTESFLEILTTIAKEANLTFATAPELRLVPDTNLPSGEMRVTASQKPADLAQTRGMETENNADAEEDDAIPANAFLIVHGTKVFPLDKNVIDIGRRMENDLSIDDPRVSRNHAQLRAIKGRFVIFDLNSTGGTFVNSQRTSQSVLYPGDVISLAGVSLIFGQDNPPSRINITQTMPLPSAPASDDRTTAILHKTASYKKKK